MEGFSGINVLILLNVNFSERDIYTIFFIGTLGILFPTVVAIFFYIFYQRKLINQYQKNKTLEANYQRELLEANIQTEEKVRIQIAKDLHDDIGARLSAVKCYISQIRYKLENKLFPISLTKQTEVLAGETIYSVRHISHNLLPPMLEDFGLEDTLQDFCEKLNGLGTIEVHFECTGYQQRLDIQTELALYRIVQELTNNTLKHAQAKKIHIYLYQKGTHIKLMYLDDGIGFDESKVNEVGSPMMKKNGKGLGLKSIESRVKVLRGKIALHSTKGQGIQVEIHVNV